MNDTANNRTNIIGIIIQGGAVAIALVVIYFWHIERTNHINHEIEAWNKNTEVMTELKDAVRVSNRVDEAQVKATELQASAIEGLINVIRIR